MKKFVLLLATALFLITNASAVDISILANNKEFSSKELSKQDLSNLARWIKRHRLQGPELKLHATRVLQLTIDDEARIDTSCELGIISNFSQYAKKEGIIDSEDEIVTLLNYLRNEQLIDDVLLRLLKNSSLVNQTIAENLNDRGAQRPFNLNTAQTAKVDLKQLYAPVKKWPDDKTNCSLDTYFRMTTTLNWKNVKERDALLERLNYMALKDGVIDQATYNKLDTFREMEVLSWPVYFKRYADVINNAKDKLTKTPEVKSTHSFSETYVSRRDKITRRTRLYMTYDSTQVMMLAQLIEKTAKRMDAKQVSLHFRYNDEGEEVYIFSPMEQYRAAIKMLRKEMGELMRSDAFQNTGLEYDDLIAAAYETGFIKSEELEYVLKFEDFWNPQTPRWKSYANFAFSLAGTATFYLPPPWNIVGAIALVLSQSKIMNRDQDPDEDDNWNVII